MEQEVVDTTETPADSAESTEPTEAEVTEEVVEEVEQAPAYITLEQMQEAISRQDSSMKSWLGRRDKETLNHIGNVINERMAKTETPDELSSRFLENPREVMRSELKAMQSEETQHQTMHLNSAMDTVGALMESDPLYTDKSLGNEVVAEIGSMVKEGRIDASLPPAAAGKLALADAVVAVFRKRAATKKSPLAGNKAGNTSAGLTPPAGRVFKPKVPKLDDETAKWAKKWNYTDEDIARVLGE